MAIKSLVRLASLTSLERRLIKAACEASGKAHCPYSNFPVGAAILTYDNKIFTGCNIESCSSGATICAERVAIFKAVSEGYTRFKALAIYAPAAPLKGDSCGCGICRQVLAEFGLDVMVLKLRNDGMVRRKTVKQLLPNAFTPTIRAGKRVPTLPDQIRAIVDSLTPDVLSPRYAKVTGRNKFFGHCYVASEALFHMQGGAQSGYVPQVIHHEGGTHWYLKHQVTEKIVDLTGKQFRKPVPYAQGKGCGFLTKKPSKRAQIVIDRANALLAKGA